jgi:hypothetical protein
MILQISFDGSRVLKLLFRGGGARKKGILVHLVRDRYWKSCVPYPKQTVHLQLRIPDSIVFLPYLMSHCGDVAFSVFKLREECNFKTQHSKVGWDGDNIISTTS